MSHDSDQEIHYLPDHSIDDLIRLALEQMDVDDDEIPFHMRARVALQLKRDPVEVFSAIQPLRTSDNPKERALFASVLAQLGAPEWPFRDETVDILLGMLEYERHPDPLCAIGMAFGHLNDQRAIQPLARLKNHPSEDVRFGVVFGLLGHRNVLAVNTLIELSHDMDRDVRDWATFGIGNLVELDTPEERRVLDTPEVREALLARVTDEDPEVRGEALIGLARRQDQRVLEHVRRELQGEFYGIWAVVAAEFLADSSLYPLVQVLWDRLDSEEKQKSWFANQFQDTLAACSPDN